MRAELPSPFQLNCSWATCLLYFNSTHCFDLYDLVCKEIVMGLMLPAFGSHKTSFGLLDIFIHVYSPISLWDACNKICSIYCINREYVNNSRDQWYVLYISLNIKFLKNKWFSVFYVLMQLPWNRLECLCILMITIGYFFIVIYYSGARKTHATNANNSGTKKF